MPNKPRKGSASAKIREETRTINESIYKYNISVYIYKTYFLTKYPKNFQAHHASFEVTVLVFSLRVVTKIWS